MYYDREEERRYLAQWDAWYDELYKNPPDRKLYKGRPEKKISKGQRELMQMQEYAMRVYKKATGKKDKPVQGKQLSFDDVITTNIHNTLMELRQDMDEVKRAIAETPELLKDVVEQMNEVLKALDDME